MLKKITRCALVAAICCWSVSAKKDDVAISKSNTIELNGELTRVYFNDGDTFKVLQGDLKGARARVVGYNALESYGLIHSWAQNSKEYLLKIAKGATEEAQSGQWKCISLNDNDVYGRLLVSCDDLAISLINKGLGHAYSIDERAAKDSYIVAQQRAQKAKLGMWKHGIPQFIITSLHSSDEGQIVNYDRLISAADGRTRKRYHDKNYLECQNVCLEEENSCMIYVPFDKRYGADRSECLIR